MAFQKHILCYALAWWCCHLPTLQAWTPRTSFSLSTTSNNRRCHWTLQAESTSTPTSTLTNNDAEWKQAIWQAYSQNEAQQYAQEMDLPACEGFYGLFQAIRTSKLALGTKSYPLHFTASELSLLGYNFANFFTMKDLEKAVEDDFLDATRGSTDNRKGWKITTVSNPRGDSFEEARMTYEDVLQALDKGTVIFNAAGAHIPKLAGPCLAVSDATSTPNAMNLYITAAGKRTSAPPHTDKQDVLVFQTTGRKFWRVYAPTDPSKKPLVDPFARGKGEDDLPLYTLQESGELLLETTLEAGDVLFVPAGFPHTTGTVVGVKDDNGNAPEETSVHMTFNIDTHVWDLDYLSVRRMALRRACVKDTALGQSREEDNRYVGKLNELPRELWDDLLEALPLGFLDEEIPSEEGSVETVTQELMRISGAVDRDTFGQVESSIWKETVERMRQNGVELLDIHRDMYLAAIEEGRTRDAEDAMTAHLKKDNDSKRKTMSPERVQRLSLFRVQRYYEKINAAKDKLVEWSYSGSAKESSSATGGGAVLPDNWAFTMPVKVGDDVEADLGGAFFPATVTRAVGGKYDVKFFDGDQESGLDRSMLKLLKPPNLAGDDDDDDDVDASNMTPKQLKRWKKQQEKKKKAKFIE